MVSNICICKTVSPYISRLVTSKALSLMQGALPPPAFSGSTQRHEALTGLLFVMSGQDEDRRGFRCLYSLLGTRAGAPAPHGVSGVLPGRGSVLRDAYPPVKLAGYSRASLRDRWDLAIWHSAVSHSPLGMRRCETIPFAGFRNARVSS
jgi:hypothetical protein